MTDRQRLIQFILGCMSREISCNIYAKDNNVCIVPIGASYTNYAHLMEKTTTKNSDLQYLLTRDSEHPNKLILYVVEKEDVIYQTDIDSGNEHYLTLSSKFEYAVKNANADDVYKMPDNIMKDIDNKLSAEDMQLFMHEFDFTGATKFLLYALMTAIAYYIVFIWLK